MSVHKNKFLGSTYVRISPKVQYDQFENFKSGWNKLGRKIALSESMAAYHSNDANEGERQKQYLSHAKSLLIDIGIHTSIARASFVLEKNTFEYCKNIFDELKPKLMADSKYYGKYIAIVNGVLQDSDDVESELVRRMFKKFGNAEMYVGNITPTLQRGMIESPEQR